MLSRLVITFLPRSKSLLISVTDKQFSAVTIVERLENAFQEFVGLRGTDFYATGINQLISHWQNVLIVMVAMTNLDSIFKSRDITLPTKVRLVKAMVFPVVMYGCESWTVKKAER